MYPLFIPVVFVLECRFTIEGTAFALGEISKNEWGIPFSNADNAISSLKGSVLCICPRDALHECAFSGDPNARICRIVYAWREGSEIKARAEVTDSVAERKIQVNIRESAWSVYSLADPVNDGRASGDPFPAEKLAEIKKDNAANERILKT